MHSSIATIDSPEFINLQPLDLNPLMSKCDIKVLYIGENRNRSFITKDVAIEMSKTLRGAPIVGYYKEQKEDFADHGEKVTFDDEGIHFECMTKPYGFVSPDADVWFQKFNDVDDFGNSIEHEYLMTTGYLWTGQFEECADVVNSGRPQSMELDEKSLEGKWSQNTKNGLDFFIINDAIFSKLCILGDDVEPCFEGASVTSANDVKRSFSLDDTFKQTLYSMMQDLRVVSEGGQKMENSEVLTEFVEAEVAEAPIVEEAAPVAETEFVESQETAESAEEPSTEFKKDEEEESKEKDSEDSSDSSEEDADAKEEKSEDDSDKEDKKKYQLLEDEFNALQEKYSALETQYNELVAFKNEIDNAKKDELINKFSMLSEDDKKEIVENKANLSYEEIESKLSILFTRQSMTAEKAVEEEKVEEVVEESPVIVFNMHSGENSLPAWLQAVEETEKSMN